MRTRSAASLIVLAVAATFPAHAAQRAFVSSTGNDANVGTGCTLAAPCRSFAAAHTAVDAGGEIVALDTAGYGTVTITKSVTIMANPGVVAGIAVSSGSGVTITTGGVAVILRGLAINDVGSGSSGVFMTAGASLSVENCVISNFGFGVYVATDARVSVVNSLLRGNNTGLYLAQAAEAYVMGSQFLGSGIGWGVLATGGADGFWTSASVSDSVASGNLYGFAATNVAASSGARLSCIRCTASNNATAGFQSNAGTNASSETLVSYSKATYNGIGFVNSGAGISTFVSQGNNTVYANGGGNTSGAVTVIPGN